MKYYLFLLLSCGSLQFLYAEKILGDLNFAGGDWTLVGIPTHNNKMLPVQKELGTFLTKDLTCLKDLQKVLDLELTFDDNCDYHYELKFYRDTKLVRTLRLNLYCGYVDLDGLSYDFDPKTFELIRKYAQPVDWSRISFGNLDLLKKAIRTLDASSEVVWYKDIKPYYFSGYFLVEIKEIPWNANYDSLQRTVGEMIKRRTGSDQFYISEYFTSIDEATYKKTTRFSVYCEESLAKLYGPGFYLPWRNHFYQSDSIHIIAIGIDRNRYVQLMQKYP